MSAEPVAAPLPAVPRHDVPKGGRSGFTIVEGRQVHYLEWGHGGRPPLVCRDAVFHSASGGGLRPLGR